MRHLRTSIDPVSTGATSPEQPSPPPTLSAAQTERLAALLPHGCPTDLPAEPDRQVAQVSVEDVSTPAGRVAVLTVDSPDGRRPTTLGPRGLLALHEAITGVAARADQLVAVAVTGRPGCFVAGADLTVARRLRDTVDARTLAELGHAALRPFGELPVPTVAWITGHALGGGLELALHCDYRVVADGVRSLGLPEASLGIVPGWGGTWLLPRLVGLPAAIDLAVHRPAQHRLVDAATAERIGLVDAVLPAEDFAMKAIEWTLGHTGTPLRDHGAAATSSMADDHPSASGTAPDAPNPTRRGDEAEPPGTEDHTAEPAATSDHASTSAANSDDAALIAATAAALDTRLHGAAPAYPRVLSLLGAARSRDRDTGFAAEDDALAELLVSDQARAALYASDLVNRSARATGPTQALPREIRRVGIVGAGLMAAQLAVLIGGKLGVPVALREVDEERAAAGRDRITDLVSRLADKGRIDPAVRDLLTVGTDLSALAQADLVIEAVTEVLEVKRQVFAELERVVSPSTILATNTSALSVTAMASGLDHPQRVVGLHFFNPVDRMPLVEVVATAGADPVAVTTAADLARRCGKTVVRTADAPGFVVNRVLLRMLSDVLAAVQDGAPVQVADRALDPLGLPMSPFALLDLVGLAVGGHVLTTLHRELGPRYRLSPGLDALTEQGRAVTRSGPEGTRVVDPGIQEAFGQPGDVTEQQVLDRVLAGLGEEIGLLLDERVVDGPEQVDLAMILGAGWPWHLGGITPYLVRGGYLAR
ncbi:3-hydroxyacyl-CoA dehydrogenase NAD-binding domain-containing protein [Cellulomonas sp. NPDC089187]|uniref:3-hydroxyacyl-CoA dehydrogenase NAD-binding domain-containing protein n=1 Tax=Cellulomonas sp. NPDC089187 TaxID=3154970 RepID=UPI003425B529